MTHRTPGRHASARRGAGTVSAALAVLAVAACSTTGRPGPDSAPLSAGPRSAQYMYFDEGRELVLGVSVRAARIGGVAEFLPLQVMVLNKRLDDNLQASRESFVLELGDGRKIPLATAEELWKDYHNQRRDLRVGDLWVEDLAGRFRAPPYEYLPLDFFPLESSGTTPRRALDMRRATVLHGFLYFRAPAGAASGPLKLLFRPTQSETTYVLPFRVL